MGGVRGPWGDAPPRQPKPGSGREALARRARARGGKERRKAAEAARRGLTRGAGNRRTRRPGDGILTRPVKGAIQELVRHSRTVQQKFLVTQRLRNVLLALAALWVVWTFLLGDTSLPRLWSVTRQNERLAGENEQLRLREAELKAEVRDLSGNSAPEALERAARIEHAMVRDGERIVRFYDPAELEEED